MTFIMFLICCSYVLHAYTYFSLRMRLENIIVSVREVGMWQKRCHKEKNSMKKAKKKVVEQLTI